MASPTAFRGSGNLIRDVLSSTCSIPLNKLHLKRNPKLKYPPELFRYFFPQRIDAIRITCLSPCLICSAEKELSPINSTEMKILEEIRVKISVARGNYQMVKDSSICSTCRKTVGKFSKLRGQLEKIETGLKFAIRLKLDKLEEEEEDFSDDSNPSRFNQSDIIPFSDTCRVSNSCLINDPRGTCTFSPEADNHSEGVSTPRAGAPISDPASILPPEIPTDAQFPLILSSEENEMYSVIVIKSSELANVLRGPNPLQELLNKQNSQLSPVNLKEESTTTAEHSKPFMDTSHQPNSDSLTLVGKKIKRKNQKKIKKVQRSNIFLKNIKKGSSVKKVGRKPIHKIRSELFSPHSISQKMGKTREKFRCNFCMLDFTFLGILRLHERSRAHQVGVKCHREKPDGRVVFACDRCELETKSAEMLLRHKVRMLNDEKHQEK